MNKRLSLISNNSMPKKLFILLSLIPTILLTYWKLSRDNILQWQSKRYTTYSAIAIEQDPSVCQIQMLESEAILKQPSIFPPLAFSDSLEKGQGVDFNHYSPVSAIISRIDYDEESIKSVVQHLLKYPFIKEIVICNQIESSPLNEKTFQQFKPSTHVSHDNDVLIHLFKDDETKIDQQRFISKFAACANATYDKCYFQDDLWLNTYLDTLYTHTHRYPDHFIVNTRPSNYKDYMTWRFKNRNLSMHTGYADLRYGAFIKKDRAQHFMSLWSTLNSTTVLGIKIGRGRDNKIEVLPSMIADIYFTVWLNQYPYLVSNPLLSANIDSFRHIDTVNNRHLVKQLMFDALSILESGLQNSTTDVLEQYAPFTLAGVPPSTIERDVRSSCANDKCLFITSINHMPNIEYEDHPEFIVNKTDNEQQQMPFFSNLSHYEEIFFQQPNAAHLNPKQSNISLTNHIQYHRAVDQDIATCWTSMKNPQAGDYFGFYMAGDIKGRRVIIYTPTNSIKLQAKDVDNLKEMFEVTVQFVLFGSWEECDIVSTKIMSLSQATPSLSLITFDFQCPSRKNFYEPFKSIRVNFKQDLEEPFELCSLGLDNFLV